MDISLKSSSGIENINAPLYYVTITNELLIVKCLSDTRLAVTCFLIYFRG